MQSAIDLASAVLAEGVGGDNPELKSESRVFPGVRVAKS